MYSILYFYRINRIARTRSKGSGGCDSDDTCSTVSNSYENDQNYVNAPLNSMPLAVESQYSIHQARKNNERLRNP